MSGDFDLNPDSFHPTLLKGKTQLGGWFAGRFFQVRFQGSLPLLIQPFLFGRREVLLCPIEKFPKPLWQRQFIKRVQCFLHGQQFFDAFPACVLIHAYDFCEKQSRQLESEMRYPSTDTEGCI
jgi:hypothetical protein